MRFKMMVLGIIAAFVISIGAMVGSGENAYADAPGCSELRLFIPPATPGVEVPGAITSEAAKNGIKIVPDLKLILCPKG